jgi:AcrR family transcriptional regulator
MRGVPRPDLREELFAAADRIMAREGAAGLTSRAVTDEAGCAKGNLHNHFDGFEGFLAQYARDRVQRAVHQLSDLPRRAGHGEVADNLTDAAVALFNSGAVPVAVLITSRPTLAAQISAAVAPGSALRSIEGLFADYLTTERDLGRLPADTDPDVLAFTLVGAIHHMFFTHPGHELSPGQVRRIVTTLLPR